MQQSPGIAVAAMTQQQDSKAEHSRNGSGFAPAGLVTTRLVPPDQNNHELKRERLLELLANTRARLVLLEAPAGYGKTTLAAQWRNRLMSEGARVAWLTQDRTDADASKTLTFIEHALSTVGVGEGARVAASLAEVAAQPPAPDTRDRIRDLLNAIAGTAERVELILDEFEQASHGLIEEVIEPLLKRAPSNLQIVLASRVHLTMRVAALSMQGWCFAWVCPSCRAVLRRSDRSSQASSVAASLRR